MTKIEENKIILTFIVLVTKSVIMTFLKPQLKTFWIFSSINILGDHI